MEKCLSEAFLHAARVFFLTRWLFYEYSMLSNSAIVILKHQISPYSVSCGVFLLLEFTEKYIVIIWQEKIR